jgi:hypothetical protein
MSSVTEWRPCRGLIIPLHKAVLRRWVVWCRTSFSQGPGGSRRSTGYQRAKADSLGRNTLATLASGVPADFGQPLGDLGRRRTRSAAHEPRSSEARPSVGTTPRRYSVSALTCFMSPALQATNAFTADAYRKSSDAFCTISPLEQTASVVACAVRQHSSVNGRRTSSTFLHSHLAMIPAGSKSGSIILHGPSSTAPTPALQVASLPRDAYLRYIRRHALLEGRQEQ